jgi:hypothetical protein
VYANGRAASRKSGEVRKNTGLIVITLLLQPLRAAWADEEIPEFSSSSQRTGSERCNLPATGETKAVPRR